MPYANQAFPSGDYSRSKFSDHERVHIQNELRRLREEVVGQQKIDGGALTAEHRAQFEQRLAVLMKQACAAGMGKAC